MTWVIGQKSQQLIDEFRGYVIMEPRPFVIDLPKSHGMYLATIDGQEIFDWAGYYGSKLIAHNHPGLSEPDYVKRLLNAANNKVSNPDYVTPELVAYYRLLHRLAPKCISNPNLKVFTVNSGAEAAENALKYMVKLFHERADGKPKVPRYADTPGFICFEQGFHGRTVYALNVTDMPHNPIVTKDFHGLTARNFIAPFPRSYEKQEVDRCLGEVRTLLQQNKYAIAGIIVEPLQGAGGHRTAPIEFFQGLSRLAHDHEVGLCFDEVQTAGGPCGSVFMCDMMRLPHPPDVVITAKKFACGVVYMQRSLIDHNVFDSTWSGTLADMVRFVQEWSIVEREDLLEHVHAKSQKLSDGLRSLAWRHRDLITNVRGVGLYQGFTLGAPLTRQNFVAAALARHSLLLMSAGTDSIRLRPSLSVTNADIELLLGFLNELFSNYTDFAH